MASGLMMIVIMNGLMSTGKHTDAFIARAVHLPMVTGIRSQVHQYLKEGRSAQSWGWEWGSEKPDRQHRHRSPHDEALHGGGSWWCSCDGSALSSCGSWTSSSTWTSLT